MRSFIVLAMFTASFAHAAWNGYTEERTLELDTAGVTALKVDAAAGALSISGDDGETIRVNATINVPGKSEDKAKKIIASDLDLSLDKKEDTARLEAGFRSGSWGWGDSPSVDLEVYVPQDLALEIEDSSGALSVKNVDAAVMIDDSSGMITVEQVGSLIVDDGSGSIKVVGVDGDVSIEDGSGSISIRKVGGSVTIDDGSGSIDVEDVEHDLNIVDDGSGSVNATNVRGSIIQDT